MKTIAKSVLSLAVSVGLSSVAFAQSAPSETHKAAHVAENHAKSKITAPASPASPVTPATPAAPSKSLPVAKNTASPDSSKPLQPLAATKSQTKRPAHAAQPEKPVVKNESGSQSGDMQKPSAAKPVK